MVAGSVSLLFAIRHWEPEWTNQRVLFFSDKTAVVAVINMQTARDPQLMYLLRQLHVCLIISAFIPIHWLPWHSVSWTSAPSSANNWTRFVAFVQKLDRKKCKLPASPKTVIAFVQYFKNEGKATSTIRNFLSTISE